MYKIFGLMFFLVSLTSQSHATNSILPAWICNLNFSGQAKGVQVIVGKMDAHAKGTLICVSPFAEVQKIPIQITFGKLSVSPRIAIGNFKFYGESLNINILSIDPKTILGTYALVQGQFAIGVGAGAMTAVHTTVPSLTLKVSLQLTKGLGLNAGLTEMTIKELN